MRPLLLLPLIIGLTACFDSEEPKKVEVVDNRTDGTGVGAKTVSDEDFAALQAEIKTLTDKLAALESKAADKSDVTALQSDVASQGSSVTSLQSTATSHGTRLTSAELSINSQGTSISSLNTTVSGHDSELTTLTNSVNALVAQTNLKQLWLYDGNKVKRHKVVSVYDRNAWQEAMVEITTGVNARYQLGRFADANPQESPAPQETPSGAVSGQLSFTSSGCTGTAIVSDSFSGADYGQGTSLGVYVAWVTSTAQRFNGYSYASRYDGSTCTSGTSSSAGVGSSAVVQLKASYSYPNPLTVGP